ncbi:MAG: hypothetical protein AB8E15_07410 [Bdellovibrionales bacterium]
MKNRILLSTITLVFSGSLMALEPVALFDASQVESISENAQVTSIKATNEQRWNILEEIGVDGSNSKFYQNEWRKMMDFASTRYPQVVKEELSYISTNILSSEVVEKVYVDNKDLIDRLGYSKIAKKNSERVLCDYFSSIPDRIEEAKQFQRFNKNRGNKLGNGLSTLASISDMDFSIESVVADAKNYYTAALEKGFNTKINCAGKPLSTYVDGLFANSSKMNDAFKTLAQTIEINNSLSQQLSTEEKLHQKVKINGTGISAIVVTRGACTAKIAFQQFAAGTKNLMKNAKIGSNMDYNYISKIKDCELETRYLGNLESKISPEEVASYKFEKAYLNNFNF